MSTTTSRRRQQKTAESGFTLVELLVAMAISTIIAIAAVASLVISRQGFTAVDAASQLRDNARFSIDLIQRLGVQSGFKTADFAITTRATNNAKVAANPDPNITGFNNALADTTDPVNTLVSRTAGSLGYGSDVLIMRFQTDVAFPGATASDGTMINCMGSPITAIPTDRDDRFISILSVGVNTLTGEPELRCRIANSAGPIGFPQPIVQGVENFQVLYGVDGGTTPDWVTDRFLRADQMVDPAGDPAVTNANWRRVRSLRIGMVIRGPVGSKSDASSQTFYPMGMAKDPATGTAGYAMSATADAGTREPNTTVADTRLRQIVSFTVHLRNEQGL